jgi:signal transduction histidine kinase/CheY-like chemotaxis protein
MFLAVVPSLITVVLLVALLILTRFDDSIERFEQKGKLLAAQLATSSELLIFSGDGSYLDPHAEHALKDSEVKCIKVIKEQAQIYKKGECQQINRPNLHAYSHTVYKPVAFRDIGLQGKKQSLNSNQLGKVIVLLSQDEILQKQNGIIIQGIGIAIPVILLSMLMAWRVGRSLSKPVVEISKTLEQVAAGNLTTRVAVTSNSELGTLQTHLNELTENLQKHESARAMDLLAIRQAQKEAEDASYAKSQFLAVMSHELRTPMNGVMGMLQLLQAENLSQEEQDYVTTAINSTEHLLTVVNDILDFSRIESGKMTVESVYFNLYELMRSIYQCLTPIAKDKQLPFVLECPTGLNVSVRSDPTRIRQVLINLIGNAIKFTDSGFVKISVNHEFKGSQIHLIIDITDTGIGISKEKLASMFDSFNQADTSTSRKYGGTGLGLSISKNLLELMGGQLKVQSQPNIGSTFSCELALPYRVIEDSVVKPLTKKPLFTIDDEYIGHALLAEDNPVNQKVAVAMLKKIGFQVDVASDGLEAFNKCLENKYDIIFMDIQMPELDGFQATRKIRDESRLNKKTPIIALSANVLSEAKEEAIDSGMNAYIAKPFKKHAIEQMINTWVLTNKARDQV